MINNFLTNSKLNIKAGDSLEDANFSEENANESILRISTLDMWLVQNMPNIKTLRTTASDDKIKFYDDSFENELKYLIFNAVKSYENMKFRDVCKWAFHEFHIKREEYLCK